MSTHKKAWYVINGITLYRIIAAPFLLVQLFNPGPTGRSPNDNQHYPKWLSLLPLLWVCTLPALITLKIIIWNNK